MQSFLRVNWEIRGIYHFNWGDTKKFDIPFSIVSDGMVLDLSHGAWKSYIRISLAYFVFARLETRFLHQL